MNAQDSLNNKMRLVSWLFYSRDPSTAPTQDRIKLRFMGCGYQWRYLHGPFFEQLPSGTSSTFLWLNLQSLPCVYSVAVFTGPSSGSGTEAEAIIGGELLHHTHIN